MQQCSEIRGGGGCSWCQADLSVLGTIRHWSMNDEVSVLRVSAERAAEPTNQRAPSNFRQLRCAMYFGSERDGCSVWCARRSAVDRGLSHVKVGGGGVSEGRFSYQVATCRMSKILCKDSSSHHMQKIQYSQPTSQKQKATQMTEPPRREDRCRWTDQLLYGARACFVSLLSVAG